jgi:hypothetical protein
MSAPKRGFMDTVVNASGEAENRSYTMSQNIKAEIAALRNMSPAQLREKYLEVFGEPTRTGNKDFLFKRVAWRLQSLAEGSLSERARQRAAELARDADIRMTMPRPPAVTPGAMPRAQAAPTNGERVPIPGTVLARQYRGRLIEVTVLPKGFEWEGQVYRSLSAVAKAVTGSHWNGHLFFGLKDGDKQ